MKTQLSKKYYVPGLISAILIPLVFWYFGNRKLNEPIPNVMDLGIPPKYDPIDPMSQRTTLQPFRNWNYKKIIVKPNEAKKNSNYYVSELRKLQQKNEKETGIQFILNDNNSYGDFASILNDFHIAKHEVYGVDLEKTGHIFALVDYKDPNKIEEPCYLCNDIETIDFGSIVNDEIPKPNFYDNSIKFSKNLSHEAFYIIFGFLLFLNVTMLNIRKFL